MPSLFSKRLLPLLFLSLLSLLAACGQQVVQPVSTAAYALSAQITVEDNAQGKMSLVAVQLTVKGDSSKILEFDQSESLTCNNVTLKWDSKQKDYEGFVPKQATTYTIVYTDHGKSSTVSVSIQQVPTFTNPTKDTPVARTSRYTVSYSAQSATEVEIDASDASGHYIQGSFKRNSGSYSSIDTTSLDEGIGTLRLVASYNSDLSNTDFGSVSVKYQVITAIDVIWQ